MGTSFQHHHDALVPIRARRPPQTGAVGPGHDAASDGPLSQWVFSPLSSSTPDRTAMATVLRLQRTHGNRFVERMVAGRAPRQEGGRAGSAPSGRSRSAAVRPTLDSGSAATADRPAPVERPGGETAVMPSPDGGGGRLQRAPGTCSWPPADPLKPPMPKHYGTVNPELRDTMLDSYKAHQGAPVDPGQDFLANGFFGANPADACTWPQTFWQALDNYDDASVLNSMAEVHDLAAAHTGLWAFISRIRQAYSTTSRGFGFATPDRTGFETLLRNSPAFCKDNPITEAIFHAGMDCHRELGKVGLPGLHVCFGSGDVHDIHVDMHMPANAKVPGLGSCFFDPFALIEHQRDLSEKDPQTVFRNRAKVQKGLEEFRATISDERCGSVMAGIIRAQLDQLILELDESEFRRMALEGFQGERDAQAKLRDVMRRRNDIINFEGTFCRNQKQAHVCVPVPTGVAAVGATAPTAAFQSSAPETALLAPAGFAVEEPDLQRLDGALADALPAGDLVGLTRGDGITVGSWDRRPRVEHLQQQLNAQGAALGVDGMFGGGTSEALGRFQTGLGLPTGETVDPATAAALEGGTPPPEASPPVGQVEGLTLNDGITFGTWERRLRVRRLQELLTGHGFACAIDGMFGPRTADSLHGFQASRGLPEGNSVDRETAAALEAGSDALPACPAGEVPVPIATV